MNLLLSYWIYRFVRGLREAARKFLCRAFPGLVLSRPIVSLPLCNYREELNYRSSAWLDCGIDRSRLLGYVAALRSSRKKVPNFLVETQALPFIVSVEDEASLSNLIQTIQEASVPVLLPIESRTLIAESISPRFEIAWLIAQYEKRGMPLPELGFQIGRKEGEIFVSDAALFAIESLLLIADEWILGRMIAALKEGLPGDVLQSFPISLSWNSVLLAQRAGAMVCAVLQLLPEGAPKSIDFAENLVREPLYFRDRGVNLGKTLFCRGGYPSDLVMEQIMAAGFEELLVQREFLPEEARPNDLPAIPYVLVNEQNAPSEIRFLARLSDYKLFTLQF